MLNQNPLPILSCLYRCKVPSFLYLYLFLIHFSFMKDTLDTHYSKAPSFRFEHAEISSIFEEKLPPPQQPHFSVVTLFLSSLS